MMKLFGVNPINLLGGVWGKLAGIAAILSLLGGVALWLVDLGEDKCEAAFYKGENEQLKRETGEAIAKLNQIHSEQLQAAIA